MGRRFTGELDFTAIPSADEGLGNENCGFLWLFMESGFVRSVGRFCIEFGASISPFKNC